MTNRATSFLVGLLPAAILVVAYAALADSTIDGMALPNPVLTPGAVATDDLGDICGRPGGRTYSRRHRVWHDKLDTLAKYHLPPYVARDYEDDDLIPICMGGDNADPHNHWTQHWPEARVKDRMDTEACRLVCTHRLSLPDARALFTPDWRRGYCHLYPEDLRCR